MIIPLGASQAYRIALREAFDRYNIGEREAKEQESFCRGFQLGWESSKHNTFQIIDRIEKEVNDNE